MGALLQGAFDRSLPAVNKATSPGSMGRPMVAIACLVELPRTGAGSTRRSSLYLSLPLSCELVSGRPQDRNNESECGVIVDNPYPE